MKQYSIVVAPIAKKQIDGLPQNIKARIADSLSDILTRNPYIGKALKADLKGLYSHRVGDYRVIYAVLRNSLLVQIVKVMHRREVYR